MPAPTGPDGAKRALQVFVGFSIAALLLVAFTRDYAGDVEAGLLYLVLSVVVPLIGVYVAAEYWNIPYTAGFLIAGVFYFFFVPGIIGQLVHPLFRVVGQALTGIFIVAMGLLFVSKLSNSGRY